MSTKKGDADNPTWRLPVRHGYFPSHALICPEAMRRLFRRRALIFIFGIPFTPFLCWMPFISKASIYSLQNFATMKSA